MEWYLNESKLLFLSSNPSISNEEFYPTVNWEDDNIIDFFENRFSLEKNYVKEYKYPFHKNGKIGSSVKFWASIRSNAKKLLNNKGVVPGQDYTLMEVVRCKSKDEFGVREALSTCTDKFLDKTLKFSNANTIVAIGSLSRDVLQDRFEINLSNNAIVKKKIGDKIRLIFTVPHPSSWEVRKLEKLFENKELEMIINHTINAS